MLLWHTLISCLIINYPIATLAILYVYNGIEYNKKCLGL